MENPINIAAKTAEERAAISTALGMVIDNEHDKGLDEFFRQRDAEDAQRRVDAAPEGEPVAMTLNEAWVLRWALEIMLDGYERQSDAYDDEERAEFDAMQRVMDGTEWKEYEFAVQQPLHDANNPPSPAALTLRAYIDAVSQVDDTDAPYDSSSTDAQIVEALRTILIMIQHGGEPTPHPDAQRADLINEALRQAAIAVRGVPEGAAYRLMLVHTGEAGLDEALIEVLGECDGAGTWLGGGTGFNRDMDWSFDAENVPSAETLAKVDAILRTGTDAPRGEYSLNEVEVEEEEGQD